MIRLNIKKELLIVMLVVLATALTACSGREDDLNRYIAEVKARPATPIPPIPPVRTYTPYVYEGLSGRDPFRRSTSEGSDQVAQSGPAKGPRPDLQRPREYLERFELDTLSMVGTFSKESSEWALIRDPDGVVHRVAVGNYIGKNHGKVNGISNDEVQLSEFIADGIGGWLVREASVALGGS
ncbi:MAG: pilus assembly protein PilP [Xanthomonadales bacterium]|jgi:type IV pilus assembly protein PilP|nr:pilus assembly protein PilP [Xanthomonadales bacterium]MDH3924493.1 pilus assembly protein PilP [Xanthomonadales bacterium]MDH3940807.1 pilus assembly protein PilP [Xanthomonadales bacterium]MDH4002359.1 pilus assembly protein PilP [Xanthomonadales bacterium]